jgi:hypothetical protein
MSKKGNFGTFAWDDHAMTNFEEKLQKFPFLDGGVFCQMCHTIVMVPNKDTIERCVLANNVK